jgi:hypothetical protein
MIFLLEAHVLSYSKRLTSYLCIRDIIKENHKQSMLFRSNRVLLGLKMGGGLQRT